MHTIHATKSWIVALLIDDKKDLPVFWAHFAICFRKNVWLAQKRLFSFTIMTVLLPVLWVSPMAFGYVYSQQFQYDFDRYSSMSPYAEDMASDFAPRVRLVDLDADVWQNEAFACYPGKHVNSTLKGLQPCPKGIPKAYVSFDEFAGMHNTAKTAGFQRLFAILQKLLIKFQRAEQAGGIDGAGIDPNEITDIMEELQTLMKGLAPEGFQGMGLTEIMGLLQAFGMGPENSNDEDIDDEPPEFFDNGDDDDEGEGDFYPEPPEFLSNLFGGTEGKEKQKTISTKQVQAVTPKQQQKTKKETKQQPKSADLQSMQNVLQAMEKMMTAEFANQSERSSNDSPSLKCLREVPICIRGAGNRKTSKLLKGMWSVENASFAIPDLNSYALFRFLSWSFLSSEQSMLPMIPFPGQENDPSSCLRSGDDLYITPINHTVAKAFRAYLSKTSGMAALILGNSAALPADYTAADIVKTAQQNATFAQSIWAVIDFAQPKAHIMLREEIIPNTNLRVLPRVDDHTDHPSAYFSSGFLTLQQTVSEFSRYFSSESLAFTKPSKAAHVHPSVVFAPVEAPIPSRNAMLSQLGDQFALSFAMALLLLFLSIIKSFVEEKECGRHSVLRVMGFLHAAYTFSTLTFYALIGSCIAVLVTAVLKYTVFQNTPAYVLFLFITLYITSLVCSAYFLSTFFNKSKTASMVSPLLFFLSTLPAMFRFPSPSVFASMRHVGARVESSDIASVYAATTGSALTIPAALSLMNLLFFISVPFSSTTVFSWCIDLIVYHEGRGSCLRFTDAITAIADETFVRYPFLLFAAYPAGNVQAGIGQSFFPGEKSVTKVYFSAVVLVLFFMLNILWVSLLGYCLDRLATQESTHRWVSPMQIPFFKRCAAFFRNMRLVRWIRSIIRESGDTSSNASDETESGQPILSDDSGTQGFENETMASGKQSFGNTNAPTVSLCGAYKEYPINTNTWSARAHALFSYLLPFFLFWVSLGLLLLKKLTKRDLWRVNRVTPKVERPRVIKAVDGIDFHAYENKITVLLGVNGAGKSTTMAMLTGLVNPTKISATSHVYGKPLGKTALGAAPNLVGFCAQGNDALWSSLTVAEHMAFYFVMKEGGRSNRNLRADPNSYPADIRELLEILQLNECLQTPAEALSGGQKRRLLFLLAFLSQEYSKLIVLDEPTAGIDLNVRHSLWNFLLRMKQRGKTIIISTHYMEEAEVLGDSIVLIKEGQIRAEGTGADLKKRVGKGYLLKLSVQSNKNDKSQEIAAHLGNIAHDIRLVSACAGEVQFAIPSSTTSCIPSVLASLENPEIRKQFGIHCVGISNTTLEEVFLELCGSDAEEKRCLAEEVDSLKVESEEITNDSSQNALSALWAFCKTLVCFIFSASNPILSQLTKWKSCAHIRILVGKKHQNASRDKLFWFYSLLFPLFLLIVLLMGWDRAMEKVAKGEMGNEISSDPLTAYQEDDTLLATLQRMTFQRNKLSTRWPTPIDFSKNRVFSAKNHKRRLRLCFDDLHLPAVSPQILGKCQLGKNMTAKGLKGYKDDWRHISFDVKEKNLEIASGIRSFLTKTQNLLHETFFGKVTQSKGNSVKRSKHGNYAYATGLYYPEHAEVDESPQHILWYRTDSIHSPPQVLSDWYAESYPDCALRNVISHPLRLPAGKHRAESAATPAKNIDKTKEKSLQKQQPIPPDILPSVHSLTLSIFLTLPIAFIPPAFLPFLIKEQTMGMRHLQSLAGVSGASYWLGNFLYDLLMSVICTHSTILLILRVFRRFEYVGSSSALFATLTLLLFFSTAALSFVYLASKLFRNPNTGSNVIRVLFSVSGYFLLLCTLFLRISGSSYYTPLHGVFSSIFPTYCLGEGLLGLAIKFVMGKITKDGLMGSIPDEEWDKLAENQGLKSFGRPSDYQHVFGQMVTGNAIQHLIMQTCIFSLLLLVLEQSFWKRIHSCIVAKYFLPEEVKCKDDGWQPAENAAIATKRVSKVYLHWNIFLDLVVHAVRKIKLPSVFSRYFPSLATPSQTIALQNFSLSVQAGEKFGFLGINGAGKTTTMRILAKDLAPTFGCVQVGTCGKGPAPIGYCPQSDCLFDFLTPFEHLRLFYDLREQTNIHNGGACGLPVSPSAMQFTKTSQHSRTALSILRRSTNKMRQAMRMHNVSESRKEAHIRRLLDAMQLTSHIHCINVGEKLSGGNKRRLNGLIALLGTNVWLLDEPSAGLDPIGRRKYWNLLNALRESSGDISLGNASEKPSYQHIVPVQSAPTLFLATHHMEEVEAICSRAMIIHKTPQNAFEENANVLADGSVLHIKEMLGAGYEITMHLRETDGFDAIGAPDRSKVLHALAREIVDFSFHYAGQPFGANDVIVPLENRIGLLRVKIRTEKHNIQISKLFTAMQKMISSEDASVNEYGLIDFTISQLSLESAFMDLHTVNGSIIV